MVDQQGLFQSGWTPCDKCAMADLNRVSLSRLELCFPHFPLLHSSRLTWATQAFCVRLEGRQWCSRCNLGIWKVSEKCQILLQLLCIIYLLGTSLARGKRQQRGWSSPFWNISFTFFVFWPGTCIVPWWRSVCFSWRSSPTRKLLKSRKRPVWVPGHPHGF